MFCLFCAEEGFIIYVLVGQERQDFILRSFGVKSTTVEPTIDQIEATNEEDQNFASIIPLEMQGSLEKILYVATGDIYFIEPLIIACILTMSLTLYGRSGSFLVAFILAGVSL